MRIPYYCPFCDQRSARRWNLQVHIKRKHGGSPDPYLASHQFSYEPTNPYHNIESPIIADDVRYSFQPIYGLQQAPVGITQYSAGPIYPPRQIIDDQTYITSLPRSAIQKIQEFKALMSKYPKFHTNPDDIIPWAIYNSINGDNTFLDDKLKLLRSIDSLSKYYDS
jgi:hypothetical protein